MTLLPLSLVRGFTPLPACTTRTMFVFPRRMFFHSCPSLSSRFKFDWDARYFKDGDILDPEYPPSLRSSPTRAYARFLREHGVWSELVVQCNQPLKTWEVVWPDQRSILHVLRDSLQYAIGSDEGKRIVFSIKQSSQLLHIRSVVGVRLHHMLQHEDTIRKTIRNFFMIPGSREVIITPRIFTLVIPNVPVSLQHLDLSEDRRSMKFTRPYALSVFYENRLRGSAVHRFYPALAERTAKDILDWKTSSHDSEIGLGRIPVNVVLQIVHPVTWLTLLRGGVTIEGMLFSTEMIFPKSEDDENPCKEARSGTMEPQNSTKGTPTKS
ncbi:hypothetical protein DL96DRAFT_1564734 [Flagelloscypha sp. PMI_526]|nr:hypothetical protein DL96DRAFT_1564734 [Flagelloscypha sp. PMI_526]